MQKTVILIIEDDTAIGELVVQVLNEAGHEPVLVADLEAARRYREQKGLPRVILSDLMVGGSRSPATIVEDLASLFPGIPVALMTGVPAKRRENFGVAHDLIIEKPFDLEVLLETITTMLKDGPSPD
jgi:DNA-binding NtrC family response regulator